MKPPVCSADNCNVLNVLHLLLEVLSHTVVDSWFIIFFTRSLGENCLNFFVYKGIVD
jgi:hypothetical protein